MIDPFLIFNPALTLVKKRDQRIYSHIVLLLYYANIRPSSITAHIKMNKYKNNYQIENFNTPIDTFDTLPQIIKLSYF